MTYIRNKNERKWRAKTKRQLQTLERRKKLQKKKVEMKKKTELGEEEMVNPKVSAQSEGTTRQIA